MAILRLENSESIARVAADRFVSAATEAIESRGKFVCALSGGSTPKLLYGLLASDSYASAVDWDKVDLLFGDDRFVPGTDDQSNERMVREVWVDHNPRIRLHPMVTSSDPIESASAYESLVRSLLGESGQIDLTYLGLGPDGHTASLFPGFPSVFEKDRLVIAAEAGMGVRQRITMTAPLLNRSRQVVFLVAGPDKAEPLKRVLEGEEDWNTTPTQAVARYAPNVDWLIDSAAGVLLSGSSSGTASEISAS